PAAAGAAPAAKPAAAKVAAAPAAKPAAARELPPLDKITDPRDLAEALRRAGIEKEKTSKAEAFAKAAEAAGATPGAAAAAAKAAAAKKLESKVIPPKPSKDGTTAPASAAAPATEGRPARIGRRSFLGRINWVIAGWGAFSAGMTALTLGCVRFMFPNVLAEPPSTIKVGLASNFEKEQVNDRWKAEWGFWIVRSSAYDGEDKIYAIQSVCTHLGCPPNWLSAEAKFKCPCHGSGFYISGVNFEGPAPRPLERFKVAVNDAGEIIVDKSQKYQEELKQWGDPDSFIVA
ncbi:MAG: Rieske Fe-S protein, partial [Planctomycetota bacterium]|nr:Rieske Fe-S protein [Planctomycetota bacterium]